MTARPSLDPYPPEPGMRRLCSHVSVYPPGGLLTVPAKLDHWLAARSGPVRIQGMCSMTKPPLPECKAG